MRSRRIGANLGEAVSFESILTVLTVLIVLRMVFLVPMVNLDKAKTESARKDRTWDRTAARVAARGTIDGGGAYAVAEGLSQARVLSTEEGRVVWIESVLPDSSVVVVRHDRGSGAYVRLQAQSRTEHPACQYGRLEWSGPERQWFTASDSVDYGDRGVAQATLAAYRGWLDGRAR
jgi:hypothetical protein